MIKPRCQKCGGMIALDRDAHGFEGHCSVCSEFWNPEKAALTRARKRFELILKITGRPVESVVALLGPCNTKQPILEVIAEADAILTELYGEAPDA